MTLTLGLRFYDSDSWFAEIQRHHWPNHSNNLTDPFQNDQLWHSMYNTHPVIPLPVKS